MPEQIEEQESMQPDFERYLDLVRRRHMHFLVPVFVGWLLVWGSQLDTAGKLQIEHFDSG